MSHQIDPTAFSMAMTVKAQDTRSEEPNVVPRRTRKPNVEEAQQSQEQIELELQREQLDEDFFGGSPPGASDAQQAALPKRKRGRPRIRPDEKQAEGPAAQRPIRDVDRLLSKRDIMNAMKRAVPGMKMSEDFKNLMQECASEFILFIWNEAADRVELEHRCTVSAEDIMWSLHSLDLEHYNKPLQEYLTKYRQYVKVGKKGGGSDDEDEEEDEEDDVSEEEEPVRKKPRVPRGKAKAKEKAQAKAGAGRRGKRGDLFGDDSESD